MCECYRLSLFSERTVAPRGRRGCWQRATVGSLHEEGKATYWSSMFVAVRKAPRWTFPKQTDKLFVFASVCLWAGQRQIAKRWEQMWYIRGHGILGGVTIPTFIDYPALVGRFVRLCWLYTQPGDWFAPAWSMLPQVKRAVPSARCLLFLAAGGVLSITVLFSCRSSW